jgi:hypothetical protein
MLHGLANTNDKTYRSVTSWEGVVFSWFEYWDNCCYSPGSWKSPPSIYSCIWKAVTPRLWVESERAFGYVYHQDLGPYFQTTLKRVNQERLKTKASHDVHLASHMTCFALTQRGFKVIKFSIVRWILKSLRAHFWAWITLQDSSVCEGTVVHHGPVDNCWMELEAAWCRVLVKCSAVEWKFSVLKTH